MKAKIIKDNPNFSLKVWDIVYLSRTVLHKIDMTDKLGYTVLDTGENRNALAKEWEDFIFIDES